MNALPSAEADLQLRLADLAAALWPEMREVAGLRRLPGGASRENWAFDAVCDEGATPLLLRLGRLASAPTPTPTRGGGGALTSATPLVEAALLRLVGQVGVPAPAVRLVLRPQNRIGDGFVMERIDALAGQVPHPSPARMARRCGQVLARIHQVALGSLPPLRPGPATVEIARCLAEHPGPGTHRPQLDVAFEWLRRQAPGAPIKPALVHGDFRAANLRVDADSDLRAVLDWKFAHLGDPMEDLGELCADAGDRDATDAGVRAELFAGYEDAGGRVDLDRVHYWEVFATLKRVLALQPATPGDDTRRLQRLLAR